MGRIVTRPAAMGMALLVACSGGSKPDAVTEPALEGASGAPAEAPVAGVEPAQGVAADPRELAPAVLADHGAGGVPEGFVIALLQPSLRRVPDQGKVGEGTRYEVDPPTPGTLRWETPTRLRWTPDAPVTPGTTVRFRLDSVEADDGPVPFHEPATATLVAPPPALARAQLAALATSRSALGDEAVVELVFTTAMDPDTLQLTAAADGRPLLASLVPTLSTRGGGRPGVVPVRVRGAGLAGARVLALELGPGARAAAGGAVAGTQLTVPLPGGGQVEKAEVLGVSPRFGASGASFEVLCNDGAVDGWTRYFWDDVLSESFWLSQRCEPDAAGSRATLVEREGSPVKLGDAVPGAGGWRVGGSLPRGVYTVTVPAGVRTRDGGLVLEAREAEVIVGHAPAEIAYVEQGRYVPRSDFGALAVRHRNAPVAAVTVRHVPARNSLFWLSGDSDAADARTAVTVAEARVPLGPADDQGRTSWVDVAALVPDAAPGVYEVEVRAGGARDVARLIATDLNVVAKAGDPIGRSDDAQPGPVDAWVLGIHDHAPRAGATVELVTAAGEVRASGRTDGDGHVLLTPGAPGPDKAPAIALRVQHEGDQTWLAFRDVAVRVSEDEVQGVSWNDDAAYRAALWLDRGVVRPGETARIGLIVRSADGAPAPADLPVKVVLQDSRGRDTRSWTVTPDATGLAAIDAPIPATAPTGAWRVRASVADRPLGDETLHVEAFAPERMEVRATPGAAGVTAREGLPVTVDARYLFGGSAAGSRVSARCTLTPGAVAVDALPAYTFGPALLTRDARRAVELATVEGTLDDDGKAVLTCPAAEAVGAGARAGRIDVEVRVFEAGSGRSSLARTSAPLYPGAHLVGLATGATEIAEGQTAPFEGVITDWAGAVAADAVREVTVTVVRLETEWQWSWDDDEGGREAVRTHEVVQSTATVPVSKGRFKVTAGPEGWGDGLLVRVTAGDALTELRVDTGWRRWWAADDSDRTPRPLAPGAVRVSAPDLAAPGETVDVAWVAPYPGRALLTVETDRAVETTWVTVKPGAQTWKATLPSAGRPDAGVPSTAYVGVLLFKDPHLAGADTFLPERAVGYHAVRLRPATAVLALDVDAPAEVRSGSLLEVAVRATAPGGKAVEGPVSVTVAAVDEGILRLTSHATPDPLDELLPRRALGVTSYETVGWNLTRRLASPRRGVGGGADGLAEAQAIKPVALWSGVVALQGGKGTVPLQLPESWRGKLRVMVVGASPARAGSAETSVVVRDPIVLTVTAPRFLIGGDEAEVPVFVSNLSGQRAAVALTVAVQDLAGGPTDAITLTGGDSTQLALADGASGTAVVRLRAAAPSGQARLVVTAKAGGETFTADAELPLASPRAPTRRLVEIPVTGTSVDLTSAVAGFLPGSETTRVWLTPNRYAPALTHLGGLLRYPHGCLEQTTSATRPLLFVGKLAPALTDGLADRGGVDAMVTAGLERVLSMQLVSGGFAYWPGGDTPTAWGTAYATHLLLDAREAGHPVPAWSISGALGWLAEAVDRADEPRTPLHGALSAEAYAHYVLAKGGEPRKARARALLARIEASLSGPAAEEALTLTRAALWLAGDRSFDKLLRSPDASAVSPARANDPTFFSDLRRRALTLDVWQDLFAAEQPGGAEDLAGVVARRLAAQPARWWTTQELAWGVSALGKRVGEPAKLPKATLRAGGAVQAVDAASPADAGPQWTVRRASERGALSLELDAAPAGTLLAIVDAVGVDPAAPGSAARGVRLTRTWSDDSGSPVDPGALTLGQRVWLTVTLRNETGVAVPNLAVTDRLPAALELDQARIGADGEEPWPDLPGAPWRLDHTDARDDRVVTYGTLPAKGEVRVSYAVRVVTAGRFTVPAATAEAMYDPSVGGEAPATAAAASGGWEAFFL